MLIRYVCSMGNKFISNASWFQAVVLLVVRLWIAEVFFMSGLTKVKSWTTTVALFADEYKVPVLSPEIAAYITTTAELFLPILLIIGLMTPLSALGLMCMTLVIELFVYPDTTEHYYWLLLMGILLTHGGGKLGLDYWLIKRFGKCSSMHGCA
jgi:putative oxidoreductase